MTLMQTVERLRNNNLLQTGENVCIRELNSLFKPASCSVRSLILKMLDIMPYSSSLSLHIKVLTNPSNVTINAMVDRMRDIYSTANIRVDIVSTENLVLPDLNDVDVGACQVPSSNEQNQLFQNRNNVGDNEVVVYFVRSVTATSGPNAGALNGCGTYPAGKPGAAIAQIASQWTLAHEVGHVLGLVHIPGETNARGMCVTPDFTRLMTGCGTSNITRTPTIDQNEKNTLTNSALTSEF